MPRPILLAIGSALCAVLACTVGPSRTSTPTPAPPLEPTATVVSPEPAPADTATLPPTLAPPTVTTPPEVPQTPLSADGPWLLLTAPDGYWALNPDGSGLTHLMAPPPYFRPGPVSPTGAHAAFVGSDQASGDRGLKLYTLSLPQGETQLVTALTGPSTEPAPDAQPGDEAYQRLLPAGQSAWSPDGRQLAFIGLMDGPSADLYLYTLDDGTVTRLTDGPSQAYQPSWSPDGQFVVQTGAHSFGTGAGYQMAGVWAARADNSEVALLYTPDSGDERLLGWLAPDQFVVDSFRALCSVGNLRVFSLTTGAFTPMFPGFYNAVALDPAQGRALVAVDQFVAACEGSTPPGLYLAAPSTEPKLLLAGDADLAQWVPDAGLFFGRLGNELVAFSADGQPAPLPVELNSIPWVSPGGQSWAWTQTDSSELWASIGGEPARSVYRGSVFRPTWSPDGQTLLFDGDGVFYAAYAPDLVPAPVAEGLLDRGYDTRLTWVEP